MCIQVKFIRSVLIAVVFAGCTSHGVLTAMEKEKLDPQLQNLITAEEIPEGLYNITVDSSGERRFGVIIITRSISAVKQAGIRTNSVEGEFVTAKLTIAELRRVASLKEVTAIKNTSRT